MLKEITEAIITEINEIDGSDIKARRYKGEFEENGEWNPEFPCALLRLMNIVPALTTMNGEKIIYEGKVIIYIADRDMNIPKELDSMEKIIELFNSGEKVTSEGKTYETEIGDNGFGFHGYGNQVEVYTLEIGIRF